MPCGNLGAMAGKWLIVADVDFNALANDCTCIGFIDVDIVLLFRLLTPNEDNFVVASSLLVVDLHEVILLLLLLLLLVVGSQCETVSSISRSDILRPILYLTLRSKFISDGASTKHVPSANARIMTLARCCCWLCSLTNASFELSLCTNDGLDDDDDTGKGDEVGIEPSELESLSDSDDDDGGVQPPTLTSSTTTLQTLNWSRAHRRLRGGKSDSSSESDGFGVINPFDANISWKLRFKLLTALSMFCGACE